jgi:hypothetical protein
LNPAVGELWEYDGVSWTRVSTAGPARSYAAMAYDTVTDRLIVVGGHDVMSGLPMGDAWAWDGTAWTQLGFTVPPRMMASIAFDPMRGKVVLYGGVDDTSLANPIVRNDLWEINGAGATLRTATALPAGHYAAAMAWNATCACMVIVGGYESNAFLPPPTNDVFTWDGAGAGTVTDVTPATGQGPSARARASFTHDGHSRSVLVGGLEAYPGGADDAAAYSDDTWSSSYDSPSRFVSMVNACRP